MQKVMWMLPVLLILAIGAGCGNDGSDGTCADPDNPECTGTNIPESCGNGFCEQGETHSNCSQDCAAGCGDGMCSTLEADLTNPCPTDCAPLCGNGRLDAGETCEDWNTLPWDGCSEYCFVERWDCCHAVPNGVCEKGCGENSQNCPEDCPGG